MGDAAEQLSFWRILLGLASESITRARLELLSPAALCGAPTRKCATSGVEQSSQSGPHACLTPVSEKPFDP